MKMPSESPRDIIDSPVTVAGAVPDFHRIPCYAPIGFGCFECTLARGLGKGAGSQVDDDDRTRPQWSVSAWSSMSLRDYE